MAEQPSASMAIEFGSPTETVTDVAVILGALNQLVEASLWIAICDPSTENTDLLRAREYLRDAAIGLRYDRDPYGALAVKALFGDEVWDDDYETFYRGSYRYPGRGDSTWTMCRGALPGEWIRRELELYDAELYRSLTGFARVQTLEQQSPVKLKAGIAGVTTAGVLLAGPVGLAPAALLGLYETALWARERWWHSKVDVAQSKARIARAERQEVQERLTGAVYQSAADQVTEAGAALAVRIALPATIDLGSSSAITSLVLEPGPQKLDNGDAGSDEI